MSKSLNIEDRDTHLESIIKSNLISCGLTSDAITEITSSMIADIVDALDCYYVATTPIVIREQPCG